MSGTSKPKEEEGSEMERKVGRAVLEGLSKTMLDAIPWGVDHAASFEYDDEKITVVVEVWGD